MSNTELLFLSTPDSVVENADKEPLMPEPIQILTVEKDDGDGLITTFSDGTTAGYVAEELLELRPKRELTEDSQKKVNLKISSS